MLLFHFTEVVPLAKMFLILPRENLSHTIVSTLISHALPRYHEDQTSRDIPAVQCGVTIGQHTLTWATPNVQLRQDHMECTQSMRMCLRL